MNQYLAMIWERADLGKPRFSGDEVEAWDVGAEVTLTEVGLIKQVENADSVVCDACWRGHSEEVIYIKEPHGSSPRAYIHCPENGRVEVSAPQLGQWEVDFQGLASAVASGLELAGEVEEFVPGRIWFLGKTTLAGRSYEFFLGRGLTWQDAKQVFGQCVRFNRASAAVMLVMGAVPPDGIWNNDQPPLVPLKIVTQLDGTRLSLDRSHLESLVNRGKRKTRSTLIRSFPTPPGTTWKEVWLTVTDSRIRVEAKGITREFSFQEAGFENKQRGGVPDLIWSVLGIFATCAGTVPRNDEALTGQVGTRIKQYISVLRKRIRALFPNIKDNPIRFDKETECYKTAFQISTDVALQFPTPAGTMWSDVSITQVRSTAIRIAVSSKERFAAPEYEDEEGSAVRRWEAAEREGEVEREYDFRTLGLADEHGELDLRGKALLAVLQNKGSIKRSAYDNGILHLGGLLAHLMGMKDSPFGFAPSDKRWTALFEASSTVKSRR